MTNQEKLEQDINEIKNAINSITGNVRRIERALARDRYIPTTWHHVSYLHAKRQLIFDKRYIMQFEKNEADLLSRLFYRGGKKDGQPKMEELVLAKIAKDNSVLSLKPDKPKAVYQAYKRIYDRVLSETRLEIFDLHYTTLRFNDFSKTFP